MATLDHLEDVLKRAAKLLDEAAAAIRDAGLNPSVNITKIGEALMLLSDIRMEIYALRPDLTPDYFKKD